MLSGLWETRKKHILVSLSAIFACIVALALPSSPIPTAQAVSINGTYFAFAAAMGNEVTFAPDMQPTNGTLSSISRGTGLTPSAAGGTFSSSGFTTSGTLDIDDYYSITIGPSGGFQMTLTQLRLDERRSATGIRTWSVRSSLDAFATDLAVFNVPDDTNTRTDQTVNLGAAFMNLTSSVEFRIYGYAAEASGGTWRVDNIDFDGSIDPACVPTSINGTYFAFAAAMGNEVTFAPDMQPTNGTLSSISRGTGLTPSAAGGTFSSSGFTTSGTLDIDDYYSITIGPNGGSQLTLTQLRLDERRSATGIRTWSVRSSLDAFATDLAVFNVPDDTNTRTDQTINLGAAFMNLTSSVEFRIYGYAAEASGGTWRVDNIDIDGSTCGGGGGGNAAIVPTCPTSLNVDFGVGGTAMVSATDTDSIVNGASITSTPVAGITLGSIVAAGTDGGVLTAVLTVSGATAPGNYTVTITYTNNESQMATCNIAVTVVQIVPINMIQGSGNTSPLVGQSVTTDGIVTAIRFNNGFFLQTEDALIDGDSNTSEGIFVFTSSAPPVAAAVGNKVRVTGTVTEFTPAADPFQLSVTQLTSPMVMQLSTGNPLPTPIAISSINGAGPVDQLAKYESMRVTFASLKVCAPTAGFLTESNATSSTVGSNNTGVFAAVINDGTPRPFREPGIEDPEPAPPGFTIPPLPRWDGNQERIRVDSEGQTGALPPIEVCTGAIVSNLTGPLYYDFRAYTLLPDPGARTITNNDCAAIPVPTPGPNELTIGSANLQRFFNDVADDETGDPTGPITEPVLTTTAYQGRLNKLSLMVRNVMNSPDIIGFQEVENIEVLTDIANKINGDLDQPGLYSAFLEEGIDVGGIDVGFLVNKNKIEILNVTQEGLDEVLVNPDTTTDPLNDRPSLVLEARVKATNYKITVINNHLRSLNGINDQAAGPNGWATGGDRVRAKRKAQAEFTANLVQARIDANPGERIILVGDFNAFQFNDGFVDSIGTIKGTPTPATMVTASSPDLVNPDLTNLIDFEDPAERYSFVFGGHAQTLDHALVTPNLLDDFVRINHGRNNSDFPEGPTFRNDFNRSERLSDHDPLVVAFDASSVQNALLYVADTSNNRIQKFDGTTWSVVGTGGTGSLIGQFRLPEAVAASPDGQALYVADTGNNRIQYSLDGGVTWMLFAGFGTSLNQVKAPQGLVLDTLGNLYVSDTLNNRILRFNGGVPGTGVPLTATNFVSSPRGLAIDKDFNLFVTDHNNSRILKLTGADATPTVSILASVGSGLSQVRNPEGVALDDAGNVFVADKGNNRILQFVGGVPGPALVMASIGSSLGQVRAPEGVTITGFNGGPLDGIALVVSDTANNRIVATVDGVTWSKVGDPFGGVGTQIGLFRSPSKIK